MGSSELLELGDTVQIVKFIYRGCVGSVIDITEPNKRNHNHTSYMVKLVRGDTICVAQDYLRVITIEQIEAGEIDIEYVDPQVAECMYYIGIKKAALEHVQKQLAFLNDKLEDCKNGGTFERSDRVRLGTLEDNAHMGT